MNSMVSYEDCLKFIKNILHIRLFDFQKEIIKGFCEGKTVRTARGVGRTMCAEAYGKYVAHLLDRNDYEAEPDVIIPYDVLIRSGLMDRHHIEAYKETLSPEIFHRDFCGE